MARIWIRWREPRRRGRSSGWKGNLSNVKPVGEGLLEYRLDFGPGYPVYFGRDGDVLVILLTGGYPRSASSATSRTPGSVGRTTKTENADGAERSTTMAKKKSFVRRYPVDGIRVASALRLTKSSQRGLPPFTTIQ